MQRNSRRLPEVIYIRRRVAALVVLLVLIGSVTSILVFVNKSESTEITAATTTTSPTTSTNKAEETGDSSSTETTGTNISGSSSYGSATEAGERTQTEAQPTPIQKDTCELNDLIVEAKSDQPNYEVGEQPHFYLTVRNPTTADCVIDLREEQLRFEVYDLATNNRVWSDIDCNVAEDSSARTFPAESERHYEAIWSRTHSAPGVCTDREPVQPGSYLLYTLVGNNNSDGQTFNLKTE